MKQSIIALLAAALVLSGCRNNFGQVVYIEATSDNIKKAKNDCYVFENEDLKVRYSFWAEHGIMGFVIYNKTDHPIYIDWKKSSMINNGRQQKYYTDKTTSNFKSYGSTYGTSWLGAFGVHSSAGVSEVSGTETVVHQERVSFISPKSAIINAFYNLTANIYFDLNEQTTKKSTVNGMPVYVSVSNFDIKFRNYLTYADNEDFQTEKHVDNAFMVKKVYSMDLNHLGGDNANNLSGSYWENPECFYITNISREELFQSNEPVNKNRL